MAKKEDLSKEHLAEKGNGFERGLQTISKSFINSYLYKEFDIQASSIKPDEHSEAALVAITNDQSKVTELRREELVKLGVLATIEEVTHKLNKSGIEHTLRYLLSNQAIYIGLLYRVILKEEVTDASGIYSRIKANAREVEAGFYKEQIKSILIANNIDVNSISLEQLYTEVLMAAPSINNSESKVMSLLTSLEKLGRIPDLINAYFSRAEVDSSNATDSVKRIMGQYLLKVGLNISPTFNISSGNIEKYDEALFVAYTHALQKIGDGGDPMNNLYSDSTDDSWDFVVDDFESIEGQGIDQESIKVASVLFYIKVLGENMRIFNIVEEIIMAWTQGRLDIPQGNASQKLYKYYKLREERTTVEERNLFYGQVLNLGNTDMIEDMTVNEDFTRLWDVLMEEAVNYIQKYETSDASDSISKTPIYRSIQDLQYNLSTHSSGMVRQMAREMYAHLQSAIDILQEQSVVDQLGYGYNKSMWKVIEQVSRTEFNSIPNVSALKTVAVEGNRILKNIAEFDEASITETDFSKLLESCESFIIAQSQLGEMDESSSENEMAETEESIDTAGDDWDF